MSSTTQRRVVITGVGLVTPLGTDRETTWQRLLQSESGLRQLPSDHLAGLSVPENIPPGLLAGGPACADRLSPELRTGEPVVDLALQAAREAVQHAQLTPDALEPSRAAVVLGTSKGGLRSFERFRRKPSVSDWQLFHSDSPALHVAAAFGFRGGAICPVAACATGLLSIDRGGELIQYGQSDIVLAGSSDASLLPAMQGSFHRLGVLAKSFTDPATACRPFDRDREGFLIGEGAAVLVLEEREHAIARGARIIAEWLGAVQTSDAFGLTQLEPESPALVHLLQQLPLRCGFDWNDVGYLNLHGTGTEMNDACEASAIVTALGVRGREIPCSSLKGMFGHLLGAAGSVETALTMLALERQTLPANRNLVRPFDGCELNLLRESEVRSILLAVKLSLGFGGHLIGGAIRKYEN